MKQLLGVWTETKQPLKSFIVFFLFLEIYFILSHGSLEKNKRKTFAYENENKHQNWNNWNENSVIVSFL